MSIDVNFVIGGEAGQGVQSVGFLISKALVRCGYHVFADQDYESRVRGGHNFFRVRVKDSPVYAVSVPIDLLVALDKDTVDIHLTEVTKGGVIIYDGEKTKNIGGDSATFSVPLNRLAQETTGNAQASNTVALGVIFGLIHSDVNLLVKVVQEYFGASKVGEDNAQAVRAGYDYTLQNYRGDFKQRLSTINNKQRMLINGNEAISLGALAAGCKFVSGYPMTPTTPIIEYIAAKAKEFDLVVLQPEDEISAVNAVIGASYAGVRAMTATSGGGFCLMVEGLSLAGMTETPIVVVLGQRPGPAIGLPTRTEQGELEFAIHAGHGDYPKVVLAPATIEDAFWLTVKAFNLADKYQLPVILITDHHLASSYFTAEKFDLLQVVIDRGKLLSERGSAAGSEYKRYQLTDSGISPRAFPMQHEGVLVVADSDEHSEEGHIIEDAETRKNMMRKRMKKLVGVGKDVAPPKIYGSQEAEVTLVGWGSTYYAIREAVDILLEQGVSVNSLHFSELWPFPEDDVSDLLRKAGKIYVVESNASGQLAHLIQAETCIKVSDSILKYDGRPFTPSDIVREVKKRNK
ncbi:MAG: 2-oxoacid:acceptor oxidoreductase subunit alpha [Dehalococcoidia bacterium]|jgi:2-oxoglutarate ferredoxin oxidoreductase subunit alpha